MKEKEKNESVAGDSPVRGLIVLALIIAALYFAKEILLPVALATLLSFVLTPLVVRLERLRIGRIASVLLVVALALGSIGGIGWLATSQVIELSNQLPHYKDNLIAKIRSVRGNASGKLKKAQEALEDISDELTEDAEKKPLEALPPTPVLGNWRSPLIVAPGIAPQQDTAVPVKVVALPPSPLSQIRDWLGPLVAPLSTTGLVTVLVIFILAKREDLRDRAIQLVGTSRLYATTEAIDEATRRLSKYLRMQLLINVIYGVVVATGLALIGVPNALLWGVLGTLLRFLPYVGPWIASGMPILLSLAVSNSWTQPLLTLSLFVVLELLVNNVLEPWLYGSSAGVSSFGVIVAAIFWTWLWGTIGLVLAMPLTVCLVVLGRYVPQLNFLSVMLGDRSSLSPPEQLYHRLLTSSDLEAAQLAEEYVKHADLVRLYDRLFIPALHLAEHDRHSGYLSERQEAIVIESARELVEDMDEEVPCEEPLPDASFHVLCVPVRDRADETAAIMLKQLLTRRSIAADITSLDLLASETVARVQEGDIDVVVLVVLPPLGSRNGRYLCKRLRQRCPTLPIIVALLDGDSLKKTKQRLLDGGATTIATSLGEAVNCVKQLRSLRSNLPVA